MYRSIALLTLTPVKLPVVRISAFASFTMNFCAWAANPITTTNKEKMNFFIIKFIIIGLD
jgi:hypothetical protein